MWDPEEADECLEMAVLRIARVLYSTFVNRFGRDPEPDEPLLFDPRQGHPVNANRSDTLNQIMTAAKAARVDLKSILPFFAEYIR